LIWNHRCSAIPTLPDTKMQLTSTTVKEKATTHEPEIGNHWRRV